ncbi:type IV secretory system conjugative DNA transfer family protein [Lysinibacillus sp. FSL M8-0337]|uniref:type IV secretory system conjugative DNA transfer family protein n=1 Tax=Lysinibacillus TaxID=400634 RepID=UPI001E30B9BF|nr:type IV secretory system conjugative DNA transfer family protein [Lysinibacillus sphaericus]
MFTHMLVVGPTRCGKTATILKPLIYQLLVLKAKGVPLGLSVIEPKGDVAAMVNEMCFEMGIPCTHIDPMMSNTAQFNPMEGEINAVAEATVIVLKGLFGKQDAFFATVQELSARNVTKLLKELHGDNIDIVDVMNTLRDERVLAAKVAELKARDGMTDLVHFFESELLGSMKDKYRQFVIGLRAQLENVVSNDALRQIMTGKSSFNIDEHYAKGGVLAVNTALGMLRTSGDAFGQFLIMHLQNGAFRRPGTEFTRIPHFLIVDEYSRYINPDVEIFLNLAAEYRVAGIFATQSLGQLELESGKISAKAMKRAILGGCRNLVVFGGIKSEDAKDFAEEFGKDKILMRQSTYKNSILLPNLFPDSYRDTEIEEYRFDATDLMDGLPRFHFVHKLLQDGHPQKPAIAKGQFVRRDWKEEREWEQRNDKTTLKMGPLLSSIPILSMLIDGRKRRKKETSCVDKQEESIHTQNLNVQSIESNNLMNQKSGQDPLNVNNRPFKTNVSTQMNGGDGKCIATEIRKDNLTSVLTKEQSKQLDGKEGFLQTEIKKLYEKNQNKSINKGSQEKIKYPESNQEINLNSKDNFWD